VRPLEGIRILDLTWVLAGGGGPRLLDALGAEAIRIEWRGHLDALRLAPPYVGPEPDQTRPRNPSDPPPNVNRAGIFNDINAGKRAISLNMTQPKGRDIFKRLVAISDVVVDSFTSETMRNWGLGYDVMKSIKPDIIYLQQSGWGYKGVYAKFGSYGPIAQAISGLTEQSGLPSPHPPAGWGYSYMDWSGAYYCAIMMLLAVYYKKRTGKGQYIDGSQLEPSIYLTGTSVLDFVVNDRHTQRTGNRSVARAAAPHGVYRCAGDDRWIAIAVTSEEEWQALVAQMDTPTWAQDSKFRTMAERVANQDELDRLVGAWTADKDGFKLQEVLQNAMVPAGVCQTAEDRVERDPQLGHLKWLIPLSHREIGTWPVKDIPFHFANAAVDQGGALGRAAPCYGQDNDYVYGDLLKMTAQERSDLEKAGII
jgi:crotonobetainyl-CoA:carnitine CoA-transferase CaiB-like acyl-CoA transferase